MASDPISSLEKAQTTINLVLMLAVLGVAGYLLYQVVSLGKDVNGAIDDLLNSLGIKTNSGGMNQPSQVPGNKTVADSVGGYDKMGASGQMWTCTGPSGDPRDMCTPVTCDANGNCTVTGAAVPATQAN